MINFYAENIIISSGKDLFKAFIISTGNNISKHLVKDVIGNFRSKLIYSHIDQMTKDFLIHNRNQYGIYAPHIEHNIEYIKIIINSWSKKNNKTQLDNNIAVGIVGAPGTGKTLITREIASLITKILPKSEYQMFFFSSGILGRANTQEAHIVLENIFDNAIKNIKAGKISVVIIDEFEGLFSHQDNENTQLKTKTDAMILTKLTIIDELLKSHKYSGCFLFMATLNKLDVPASILRRLDIMFLTHTSVDIWYKIFDLYLSEYCKMYELNYKLDMQIILQLHNLIRYLAPSDIGKVIKKSASVTYNWIKNYNVDTNQFSWTILVHFVIQELERYLRFEEIPEYKVYNDLNKVYEILQQTLLSSNNKIDSTYFSEAMLLSIENSIYYYKSSNE